MENFLWVHLLSRLNNDGSEANYVFSFKYLDCEVIPWNAEVYLMWALCIRIAVADTRNKLSNGCAI